MDAKKAKKGKKPAEKPTPTQHLVLKRILEQVIMTREQIRGLNLRVSDLEALLPTVRLEQRGGTARNRSIQEEIPEPIED